MWLLIWHFPFKIGQKLTVGVNLEKIETLETKVKKKNLRTKVILLFYKIDLKNRFVYNFIW